MSALGFGEILIGIAFAIPTIIYAMTAPIIHKFTKIIRKGGVILLGYFVSIIAYLLIGPSVIFGPYYNSGVVTMIGYSMLGFACSMIIIPILPDIIEAVE